MVHAITNNAKFQRFTFTWTAKDMIIKKPVIVIAISQTRLEETSFN